MRLIPTHICLIALLGTGACSPYDPSLGPDPFLCGTSDPKCPDGYECVDVPDTTGACVKEGGDAPDNPDGGGDEADAGPFVCNNDSMLEPNDDIGSATPTLIPDGGQMTFALATLAICPHDAVVEDVDVYRLRTDLVGQNIAVALQTNRGVGELALEILNGTGVVVATGTYTDNSNMTAALMNAPVGTWHVQVRGAQVGVRNNYTAFTIAVTAP